LQSEKGNHITNHIKNITTRKQAIVEISKMGSLMSYSGLFGMQRFEFRKLGSSMLNSDSLFFEDHSDVFEENIKDDEWL
jgi:hypothetical protein